MNKAGERTREIGERPSDGYNVYNDHSDKSLKNMASARPLDTAHLFYGFTPNVVGLFESRYPL